MGDKTRVEFGNLSDVGKVRQVNEDYFGTYKGDSGELFIVCDGMGGYKGGRVASTTAVDAMKRHFEGVGPSADMRIELFNALKAADREITVKANEDIELGRMGSTAVVVLISGNRLFFAHIGDSRIYRVRDGEIERLTRDHSLVQEMVDNSIITEEQAENHPQRNVILRSLGPNGNSEPQVDPRDEVLFKDDVLVLCSDGLTGHVEDREIRDIVLRHAPPVACERLVNLANERGGKDNITVQVIRVVEGKKRAVSLRDRAKMVQAGIIFGAALILLLLYFLLASFNQEIKIPEAGVKDTVKTSTGLGTGGDSGTSDKQKPPRPETNRGSNDN